MKIKPIRFNFQLDSDRDGVVDHKDCMPFNPKFQHISKIMRRRLKESPLYVTDKPIIQKDRNIKQSSKIPTSYPIMSKEAKREAPVARREMLSAVKKYPGIIGEMERQKPKRVVYSSVPPESKQEPGGGYDVKDESYFVRPFSYESLEKMPLLLRGRTKRTGIAAVVFHESKHRQQDREGRLPHYLSQVPKEYKENLEHSPWEEEAQSYVMEKLEEYPYDGYPPEKPSGKEISKVLQLDEDDEDE